MQPTLNWFKRACLRTRALATGLASWGTNAAIGSALRQVASWTGAHLEQLCLLPLLIFGSSVSTTLSSLLVASFLAVLVLQNALSEVAAVSVFMRVYGQLVLEGAYQVYQKSHLLFLALTAGSFLLGRFIGLGVKQVLWVPMTAAQTTRISIAGGKCFELTHFACYYVVFLGLKLGALLLIYLGFFINLPLLSLAGFGVLLSITGVGNLITGVACKYQEHCTYVYTLLLLELLFVLVVADLSKLSVSLCEQVTPESWGYVACHAYQRVVNL